MSGSVKRQYSKGRFVVTEDSAAAIAAGPASPLDCIPEQSPARVVKKGRFRIWTCLGCVNSVRTFSEEEELLMPPAAAAALKDPVVEGSRDRERQATPESSSTWDCKPKALQVPASRALHQQERDQASIHRASWDSTSSFLSSTFSTDSSACSSKQALRNRIAACSDVSSGCADTPKSLASDQGHVTPLAQQQQQQGTATPTAVGVGGGNGVQTPPSTHVRCYQRGRFAVEEAVQWCAPPIPVARTMSCPLALQLPPPVVLQACSPLHVSTSAVFASSAGAGGAMGMSPLCLLQRPQAPTTAAAAAADASPLAGPSAAAAAAAARAAIMAGADRCLQRQPVVSYYRRGRFLVQTVA